MAAIVEVRKGDTVRQMSEYSYMLLKYANGAREGWVYIRHISGNTDGFDPAGGLNQVRPGAQTTAMAQPFIPDEFLKRQKPAAMGVSTSTAVAVDPNAGATGTGPGNVDPNAGITGTGSDDPNAATSDVKVGPDEPGKEIPAAANLDATEKATTTPAATTTDKPKSKKGPNQ